jgi:diguanylate cyclase (GGDEF)-like protein
MGGLASGATEAAILDVALESMPYGFSIWDEEHRLVLWNARYAEIYTMPAERIYAGMSLFDICALTIAAGNHPGVTPVDLHAAYRERLDVNQDPARIGRYEKAIRGRHIGTNYRRIPDLGWVVTHADITEHREREEELKRQTLRLEAAVNNMSQGLCMFDAEHRLVICNRNFATLYNLPPDLVSPGTSIERILAYRVEHGIHPVGGKEAYFAQRLAVVRGGEHTTDTVELTDGRVISILHHPMPDGGWVATHQDVTEQHRLEERIRHMARHDPLTGLPNRLAFREIMDSVEERIRRREMVAVLAVDLDHFKSVNDTLGHGAGDALLKLVSDRLKQACREGDTIARLGGDEFAVLTGPLQGAADAAAIARRIVKKMTTPCDIDGHRIVVGASVGIAIAPLDGTNAETLTKNADVALYRAKADGRVGYHFFEKGMDAVLQARRQMELGLRQALAADEFRLVFQPLLNLAEQRVCALEALLRWDSPERGGIPPSEFIPIAEETGLIVPIGEWVLREACKAAARWPENVRVAVNLSTVQVRNRDLYDQVRQALEAAHLPPDRLELEVTESLLLVETEMTLLTLHNIRNLGVHISMDDFGTGYSSLSYLRLFPFDKIKIDRSFVKDLSEKHDSRAIVSAVVGLGRSLGISTTAEGVETEAQLDAIREQGCTEVQGYLFSPPLPPSAVDRLFEAKGAMEDLLRRSSEAAA